MIRNLLDRLRRRLGGRSGDLPADTPRRSAGDDDFAQEHSRPTFADEPSTEGPDESVPRGRGGAGGMDPR